MNQIICAASELQTTRLEKQVISRLLKKFKPRVSDAAEFAIQSRVILTQSTSGIAFDIAMAGFEFEKQIIDRGSYFNYAEFIELLTISAEDLVVMKSFAGRDQDWLDVQGIIECNPQLDRKQIEEQLSSLLELQPEGNSVFKLNELIRRLNG